MGVLVTLLGECVNANDHLGYSSQEWDSGAHTMAHQIKGTSIRPDDMSSFHFQNPQLGGRLGAETD